MNELDVVEIVKTLRIMKFLMSQQTTKAQREMVKFFDYYTLKSENDTDSDATEINRGSNLTGLDKSHDMPDLE